MSGARSYTQSARAAASAATRDRLCDAAGEAFLAGDWSAVTLEALARAAGTTKQTLLRHFGSKDGLLAAAHERGYARVRDQRLSAPAGDVGAAIENLLDHYEEAGEAGMRIGALSRGGSFEDLGRRARALHYEWVDHVFAPWLVGAGRTQLRAALIAVCDVQVWWILSHDLGLPRPAVRDTLALTIRRLLREET